MSKREKAVWLWLGVIILFLGLLAEANAVFWQTDYSLRQNERRHKFGAVYMTLNNPFYEIIDEELRAEIETRGDVLLTRNPELDEKRQLDEIAELLAGDIEILFLNAVDWQKIEPALKLAKEARVPVIAIDTNVGDGADIACTIVSDNYQAGASCAEHLKENSPGGSVVLLCHSETKSGTDRINGFLDTLKKYPQFKVVDSAECKGQLEIAMPKMQEMLERNAAVDIVMALNDPTAMGALAALKNEGKIGQVMVYGVDGTPETRAMIAEGSMTATAAQSPRQIGRIAANKAYDILDGKPHEKVIMLKTTLITKENAAIGLKEEWQ
jgi:ribose transport system substrate-binding protein